MYRSHTPLSDEQIMRYAPSIFAAEPHESRGERYTYIPTVEVLDGLRKEGFMPMQVGQTRCRDEGKREHTKHMIRFRHHSALGNLTVGAEVPELVLLNSHDGTSSYNLMGGIYRLICSNGMVVGNTTSEVKVRHSGNVLDNVIEGSYEVINDVQRVIPVIDDWKRIELDFEQRKAYAEAALGLRWDDESAPISAERLADSARRSADRGNDLWRVFNRVQENLIRGGLRGVNAKGKVVHTRGVSSVSQDVKLNRQLWSLTQKMAELATA
jgi:hypothetical protein